MTRDRISRHLGTARTLLTRRLCVDFDRILFELHDVPPRKLLNWVLAKWSMHLRPARPWAWPTHLQVEPSTLCNVRCTFCPVTTGLQRPTGLMDLSTFRKALNELGDYLLLLNLWAWGEPFLNPAIYDMIAHARKCGVKVLSSTNGHVFARGDHAQRLVGSGIDAIIFALDGLSQQTYETYRAGGRLEVALAGVRRVVQAKRTMEGSTQVHLRFLAMRHNEHEIPGLERMARGLGVDGYSIKTLNPYDQGECYSTKADGLEFIPQDPRYQRFEYDAKTGTRVRVQANPCLRLWNHPVLHWDGKVAPCDFDPHDHYTVGDLDRERFRDIWWGARATDLRRQFRRDYRKLPLCAGCTYAFKGGNCSLETIAEARVFKQGTPGGKPRGV